MTYARFVLRRLALASLIALAAGSTLQAETKAFDLAGPSLRASVTHGGSTLPLSQVPNLSVGDRVRIAALLPAEQGARYRMILAFLRGATNPPPKKWLVEAETWRPGKASIDTVVPDGAEQALVLLVPDTLPPAPALSLLAEKLDKAWPECGGSIRYAAYRSFQTALDTARLGQSTHSRKALVPRRKGIIDADVSAARSELAAYYVKYLGRSEAAATTLAGDAIIEILSEAQECE